MRIHGTRGSTKAWLSVASLLLGLISTSFVSIPSSQATDGTANLHAPHRGSYATNSGESCPTLIGSRNSLGVPSDELDSWHFVLDGNDTRFKGDAFVVPIFSYLSSSSMVPLSPSDFVVWVQPFAKHAYVYTKASMNVRLDDASASVTGSSNRFMLSHTCAGKDISTPTCSLTPVTLGNPITPNYDPVTREVSVDVTVSPGWVIKVYRTASSSTDPYNLINSSLSGNVLTFRLPNGVESVFVEITPISDVNCLPVTNTYSFSSGQCPYSLNFARPGTSLGSFSLGSTVRELIGVTITGSAPTSPIQYEHTVSAPLDPLVVTSDGSGNPVVSGTVITPGVFVVNVVATLGCASVERTFTLTYYGCSLTTLPSFPAGLPDNPFKNLRVGGPQINSTNVIKLNDSFAADSYAVYPVGEYPTGLTFTGGTGGISVTGSPLVDDEFQIRVVALLKEPYCGPIEKTYSFTIQSRTCDVADVPVMNGREWTFLVGQTVSIGISGSNTRNVLRYELADGTNEPPAGIVIRERSSDLQLSGRPSESGTYDFSVKAVVDSATRCNDVSASYRLIVLPQQSSPTSPPAPPPSSPTPSPSSSPSPAASNTPEPEPTPSGDASPSPRPTPVPTVTIFVTASPTSTPAAIIPGAPVPVPTPTRTFEVVEQRPTSARTRTAVTIQCGEVITLNLKELTRDGSTFEITSLPKTGKILQPNPDTLIYIPDKEQCELGGNDTFSYAMTDKNGNVKTVERIVRQVTEGDVPKWIRTGYVEENERDFSLYAIIVSLLLSLLILRKFRRKSDW